MGKQDNIWQALDRAYDEAETIGIDSRTAKLVIFSDQHKGKRDGADDFHRAEKAYNAALGYYLTSGYSLFALGDVEELWECSAGDVIQAYRHTLQLEGQFHADNRYERFFGNHDDLWESPRSVEKYLHPLFPKLEVREGLRLQFTDAGEDQAELFLVHGHQGSGGSDQFRWISQPVVRYIWRPIQRLTGWRLNSPATSFKLRGDTNRAMFGWARQKHRVVLIAGHTHKPVFLPSSQKAELEQRLKQREQIGASTEERASIRAELEWLRCLEATADPTMAASTPCYFNTGCCCYDDGDCTGIEIADGEIRLVRWPDDAGEPRKKVLRHVKLAEVLTACK